MNVLDQDGRPILFDDTVRPFMLEVMARRANVQLQRLKKKNPNAFMYIDEPGLQFIFSAMSGYGDQAAKGDLDKFFSLIERPRGVHLCGNPDWDFLAGPGPGHPLSGCLHQRGDLLLLCPVHPEISGSGGSPLLGDCAHQL